MITVAICITLNEQLTDTKNLLLVVIYLSLCPELTVRVL